MATNLSLNQSDLTRVAQQMITQQLDPKVGTSLGAGIKAVETALLNFDPQCLSANSQPLGDNAPLLAEPQPQFTGEAKAKNASETKGADTLGRETKGSETEGAKSNASTGTPADQSFNSQASLLQVLAQLGEITSDLTLSQLQQAASQLASTNQALADHLDQLGSDYQAAVDSAEQLTEQAQAKGETLLSAQQSLADAQQAVKQAQASLDKHPSDPSAQAALTEAQRCEASAQAAFDQAQTEQAEVAQSALDALELADGLHDEINTDLGNLRSLSQQSSAMSQKHLDTGAKLALVMAMLSNSIADSLEDYQQGMAAMAQASQEKRIEKEKADAEERQKEADKQAAMSKNVNCAMKILGALITVVATVGALFTGGTSLAFAAAGLAMLAVDSIVKAATGTSLTERIMQPLMEHVLKPIIDAISKAVTQMLEACGVSKEDAEMAGNIIGAVVGMVVMVAAVALAMVAGKSAAQKLLKPMMKMAEKMIAKLIPQVLKEIGSEGAAMVSKGVASLTKGLEKAGGKVMDKFGGSERVGKLVESKIGGRERIGNWTERGANVMRVGKEVTNGSTTMVIADSQKTLDKLKALIEQLETLDAMDAEMSSAVLKHVKALMAMLDGIDSSMSDMVNADTDRNNFILNNLAGHAA